MKKLLGRRIKELRKLQNLKQEDLAEKIGIAARNMSNIETGRCFPSPDNLEKISIILKCRVKDLFDFEHQQDSDDLISDIIIRIQKFDNRHLRDFYKIARALTD
ncbi:helix-turn-helix transcriptional regulator [bacterium]|nr:helix-turn-helix transcriptional regulator [bacterium]